MTKTKPPAHPQGATLPLGGEAHAHPTLEPLLEPIDTPVLYPGNPRRGDQDGITASIRDLGLYAGIICQRTTRHVLVGNHRLRGLLALGAERVPITWVDVDDTRAAAIVARDNLTSDRGGYDRGEQYALLRALADDDALPLSGYLAAEYDTIRTLVDLPVETGPQVNPDDALAEAGVRDFDNDDLTGAFTCKVNFATEADWVEFCRRLDIKRPRKRMWFPEVEDRIEAEIEHVAAGADDA